MFYSCDTLEKLNVSSFDTSLVTDISFAFPNLNSISSLDVSHFKTDEVIKMTEIFSFNKNLEILKQNFYTHYIIDFSSMFNSCKKLKMLDLSNFDTSKATTIASMLFNCSSLTSLNINNFNTSLAINMSNLFNGCNSLNNLNVKNFKTKNKIK